MESKQPVDCRESFDARTKRPKLFLSLLIAKPVSFHSCERRERTLQICYLALPSPLLYANEYSFKSKDMNRYLLLLLFLPWMSDVTNGE